MSPYPLLEGIDSPADLRRLDRKQLPDVAQELRRFIVESVASTGGHFSSNLGTVELTIALHYVFNTPDDRLVWDVGHQTYGHKILTGRRTQMGQLRQKGGPAGFPRREESEYDTFGTAHSSTSISAAIGMAVAARAAGSERRVVAVIGDGAMTAGMAFEALNNAKQADANVIVVLNDNDMSISENVGALNNYLAKLMSGRFYAATKQTAEKVLAGSPPLKQLAKRIEEHAKGMITPSTLFEEFGFNYTGPIDGHNVEVLIDTLNNVKRLKGPQFLHVVTKKGQGYKYAEEDPITYHGPGKFDPEVGLVKTPPVPGAKPKPTYTQVFGEWLCDMARLEPKLVAITPAMREGSGMVKYSQEFPTRYFDVGIAEQHAVTFAAGLAVDGAKPVVAIYSTFLQRAYDQLIHDVALQNLPVVFALDRGGLVGADGPTHHGAFDLAFLRCIPNMTVMAPADENECRQMLFTATHVAGPSAVRYPRGAGPGVEVQKAMACLPVGRGEIRREGKRVAILAFGTMLKPALEAGTELGATVANMRFVKPLDDELVARLAATHELLVTVEEGVVNGGAGSAVLESLHAQGFAVPVLVLGLPDAYVEHGDAQQLLADCGLDRDGLLRSIRDRLAKTSGAAPEWLPDMKKTTFAAACLATALAGPAFAQKPCSKADEGNAQKAIDRISSWATLNSTWKSFRHCDSGAVGESFTDAVLRLVIDWKSVNQLADGMKDAEYKEFILTHLRSPEAKADAPDVFSRAKANCPKGLEEWCKEIQAAVKEAPPPPVEVPALMPSIRPPEKK